jgi:hypothetical protein
MSSPTKRWRPPSTGADRATVPSGRPLPDMPFEYGPMLRQHPEMCLPQQFRRSQNSHPAEQTTLTAQRESMIAEVVIMSHSGFMPVMKRLYRNVGGNYRIK